MPVPKQSQNQAAAVAARDLKHKVLTCLHKLSDRDTHAVAASELEAVAKSLSIDTLPSFISSIIAVDSSDKSAVRKQCLNLISVLAVHHGDLLSPYLSKLLSAVLRRLRDTDSSIRSACISASSSIASHVTRPTFSTVSKPFLEALFTEQDVNSQIGTALCLAAVIEAAAEPDLLLLRKTMVRFEKLVKCEAFKAKAAVLVLIGSVVDVGVVAGSKQILGNLVPSLVEVLSSEDWAVRKAAAEALMKLAVVEKEALPDFKSSCLKTFEAKKFDKVKAVRETMNQMVEVWKEIRASFDESYGSPDPQSYCQENASHSPLGSRTSCTVTSNAPLIRRKQASSNSPLYDGSLSSTARRRSPLGSTDRKMSRPMFRKLDKKKTSDLEVGISTASGRGTVIYEDKKKGSFEEAFKKEEYENRLTRQGVKRTPSPKADSHVSTFHDEKSESTIVCSNETGDSVRSYKESEDLSLIHKQLLQIEKQQANLLDLMQKFMGSSQSGMQSLETRVHGLELALDEISFDLAMSTGRMSNTDSSRMMCCNLPGTEFLSSKLWRRTGGHFVDSRFTPSNGIPIAGDMHTQPNRFSNLEALLENRRSRLQGGHAIIMNPLAKPHSVSHGHQEVPSLRVSDIVQVAV